MSQGTNYTFGWLFFGFSGRIRRSTYILSAVLMVTFYSYVFIQIGTTPADTVAFGLWGLVLMALLIISAWVGVALSAKRLHDVGYSGYLAIVMLIPALSVMFFLVLCAWAGQPGRNRFGESPITGANNNR